MPAASLGDWVWWLSGWGLVAAVGVLILVLMFRDRSRGRLRCPRCWYDMRGIAGVQRKALTCPECGKTAKNERALRRTRRRWRWLLVLPVMALIGSQIADQARRKAEPWWMRVTPTPVLMFFAEPVVIAPSQGMMQGLFGPPSPFTVNDALQARGLGGWGAALAEWVRLDVDANAMAQVIKVRSPVPAGVFGPRFFVAWETVLPLPRPRVGNFRVEARPDSDPTLRAEFLVPAELAVWGGMSDYGAEFLALGGEPTERRDSFVLPPRAAGDTGKHVERMTVRLFCEGWVIGKWRVEVPYDVVATLDEAITPVNTPEMEARVRASLHAIAYDAPKGRDFMIGVTPDIVQFGLTPLKGEVIVDGVVAASLDAKQCFSVLPGERRADDGPHVVRCGSADIGKFVREKVRVRVTGDAERGFSQAGWSTRSYWAGTIEAPLDELVKRWSK